MRIQIDENMLKKYHFFNFEKTINQIIKAVPPEHLLGLEKIWVTDHSDFERKVKGACGFYYGKQEGANIPTIIINISNLFKGIPKFIFFFIPLVPKLFLASTFYHEVAHHYQRLRHGIKKEKWEIDANAYSRKMMLKMFKAQIWFTKFLFWLPLSIYKIAKRHTKYPNTQTQRNPDT